jgi:hypothetical protein
MIFQPCHIITNIGKSGCEFFHSPLWLRFLLFYFIEGEVNIRTDENPYFCSHCFVTFRWFRGKNIAISTQTGILGIIFNLLIRSLVQPKNWRAGYVARKRSR